MIDAEIDPPVKIRRKQLLRGNVDRDGEAVFIALGGEIRLGKGKVFRRDLRVAVKERRLPGAAPSGFLCVRSRKLSLERNSPAASLVFIRLISVVFDL